MGRTSSRRGKKRTSRASASSNPAGADVAASYYVGYVEDLETPEMIMKKFEMLEQIERQHSAAAAAAAKASTTSGDATASVTAADSTDSGSTGTGTSSGVAGSSESPAVSGDAADLDSKRNAATSNETTAGLSEEQMEKLFKATSTFTVAAVMNEGHALERAAQAGEDLYDTEEFGYDYGQFVDEDGWGVGGMRTARNEDTGEELYLFEDDNDDLWEECFGKASGKRKSRKRKEGGGSGAGGERAPRSSGSSSSNKGVTQIAFVSDMRGQYVTALKRVRIVDPNAITYQRIPPVLPESWAKRIQPYVPINMRLSTHAEWSHKDVLASEGSQRPAPPAELKDAEYIASADVLKEDLVCLAVARGGFQGIYMDPPWREPVLLPSIREASTGDSEEQEGSSVSTETYNEGGLVSPEDLLSLGLGDKRLSDAGFLYVWTPKHLLGRVLGVLETMDWHYVENAISVRQSVDNDVASESSRYFRNCKDTLLICRRGKKSAKTGKITWAPIEIRHQRISDVHFDFVKPQPQQPQPQPQQPQTKCEETDTSPPAADTDTDTDTGTTVAIKQRGLRPYGYVHNMAETMLPQGRYNGADEVSEEEMAADKAMAHQAKAKGAKYSTLHGQLLSLWTPPEVRRTGWVCVSQATPIGKPPSTTAGAA